MDALRRTGNGTHGPVPHTPEVPESRLELEPLIAPPPCAPAPAATADKLPQEAKSEPAGRTVPTEPPPRHALTVGLLGATALGALAIGIWFEMRPLALPERPHPRARAAVTRPPEAAPEPPPFPPSHTAERPDTPIRQAPGNTTRKSAPKDLSTTPQPDTAIRLQPGAGTGNTTSLAHAAYLGNRVSQAEMLYREALQAEPDNLDALRGLGTTLARQHRWAEAGRTYSRARNIAPDDPDLSYNLAVALDRAGQPGAAANHYRQALTLATRSPARFNPAESASRLRTLTAQEPSP